MTKKPWLNEDGSSKSDTELRVVSRNWHPDVWDEYLSLFDVQRQESVVLPPVEIDKFSSEEAVQLSDEIDESLAEECVNILLSTVGGEEKFLIANYGMVFICYGSKF